MTTAKQSRLAQVQYDEQARIKRRRDVAQGPQDGLVGPACLPGVATDGHTIQAQAARLSDPQLQTVQRQALAGQIGRAQGNRHLRRTLARLQPDEETVRLAPLSMTQHLQTPTASLTRITHPSEAAEAEAETAARAIVSGREVSIEPRGEMVGAIARLPVQILRHNWERVALLLVQAQREMEQLRPRQPGGVPEPPDMTPIHTLQQAEALIGTTREDENFPPSMRNGANQILRNTGITKSMLTTQILGGPGGAGMAGLLRELRTLAAPDRIYRGLIDLTRTEHQDLMDSSPEGQRNLRRRELHSRWSARVWAAIEAGEEELSTWTERRARPGEYSRFQIAYENAARLRTFPEQPREAQARILAVMRKLEQVIYSIPGAEHLLGIEARPGSLTAGEDLLWHIYSSTWGHWQRVYHALGGTGTFIGISAHPTRSLPPPTRPGNR